MTNQKKALPKDNLLNPELNKDFLFELQQILQNKDEVISVKGDQPLERKTKNKELLKKILLLEKSILKKAKSIGLI